MAEKRIQNIYLHLTKQCNLSCTYCYFDAGARGENELSLSQMERLFEDIKKLCPRKIVITGGEALLREDFFDISHSLNAIRGATKLCLISNGTLINELIAKKIVNTFDEVRISLDGPKEVNDRLRGQGAFDGAIKAIRYLWLAGISPEVSITATSRNVDGLPEFLTFLKNDMFVSSFHVSLFRPVGRGLVRPDLEVSWREVQSKLTEYWRKCFGDPSVNMLTEGFTLADCGRCGIGQHINILPDGSVFPCHVLSFPEFYLGNIKETSLIEIIDHSILLDKLRKLDFNQFYSMPEELDTILQNAECMGEVFIEHPQMLHNFCNFR